MKKLVKSVTKRGSIFAFFALLALAALNLALLPKAVVAGQEVPIQGTYGVTFSLTPTDSPGVFSVVANGIGRASHLGNSFLHVEKTVDVNPTPWTMSGTFAMTAANKDTLSGTLVGVVNLPDADGFASFSGEFTFTEGTGRFEGTSGSASFTGVANFPKSQAIYSFQGSVSSPGSSGE